MNDYDNIHIILLALLYAAEENRQIILSDNPNDIAPDFINRPTVICYSQIKNALVSLNNIRSKSYKDNSKLEQSGYMVINKQAHDELVRIIKMQAELIGKSNFIKEFTAGEYPLSSGQLWPDH